MPFSADCGGRQGSLRRDLSAYKLLRLMLAIDAGRHKYLAAGG
jgi:hypothetical protein